MQRVELSGNDNHVRRSATISSQYIIANEFGSTNLLLFFILARAGTVIIMQVLP